MSTTEQARAAFWVLAVGNALGAVPRVLNHERASWVPVWASLAAVVVLVVLAT
ncbi:hypothetical protein AB0J80_06025 [Actinoplanes sp. NPDC049548]|uniref:hypothetical protein n=1 Tax=Actinoplanes sp. NPDC049548 TaxID=3155152 RepID=UPI00343F103C